MKRFLSTIVLGIGGWGLACAQTESPVTRDGAYWTRTVQGPVDAAGGRLRVETTGNVTLKGVSGDQAGYTLTVRVKAADQREAQELLDRVNVKTGTEGGWAYLRVTPPRLVASSDGWPHLRVVPSRMVSPGMELTVTGPRALRQVRAETRGGNVQASDWDGDFEAQSAGGQISADRIRGRGEFRTAGGDIEVGTVNGPLRCSSGGGTIRVQDAGADVALETAGGEIFVHQASGPLQASTGGGNIRVDRAASTVVVRTAGGLIQVQQAAGPVTAESSGGAIQVSSDNGVRCESAGGAIRLRNSGGPVRAFANSGSILAELDSARNIQDSVLSTNAGDITVVIPSNLRLTIEASNESGGDGRIRSDFPEIHSRGGVFGGAGPLMVEGALNGGGPMLRVNVVGGTIYLRRAK
jgi:DUF4097 and DUF4098 domain-containing protein YvlB